MSPHWLVPVWAEYLIIGFVVVVLVLVLGPFNKS